MNIQEGYLTPNSYSRPGKSLPSVKGIVVHWVGNASSTALNNRHYFESLKEGEKNSKGDYIYASSHYIVGLDGEIIACVPENEVAYHASKANGDHIGIEVCHPDWEGKFNNETYAALIELLLDLCSRYKLDPLTDIIRHYDVTGKDCPSYYVKNPLAWERLKEDVLDVKDKIPKIQVELNGIIKEIAAITIEGTNYVELRGLADDQILVSYDPVRKLPIIKVK